MGGWRQSLRKGIGKERVYMGNGTGFAQWRSYCQLRREESRVLGKE